jgi:hypothetical protein
VALLSANPEQAKRIDEALASWRQGDVALQEQWFIHAADPRQPLTAESEQATGDLSAIQSEVAGLMVVTQTCDIVRSCIQRPFIEVVPLVQVDESKLLEVKRGRRPAYASIPALEEQQLVADLDRVMTVEKSLVAAWTRTPGWVTDVEARELAQALARKRARFAFPDDFTSFVRRLQGRLQEKHDKQSDEGRALRALREIRVGATPSWDAPQLELTFWFIIDEDDAVSQIRNWGEQLEAWLRLIPASGRFTRVDGLVVELEDMTARDYVESDRLDLDHLSSGKPEASHTGL